jgi:hypothetical protein
MYLLQEGGRVSPVVGPQNGESFTQVGGRVSPRITFEIHSFLNSLRWVKHSPPLLFRVLIWRLREVR